MPLKDILVHVDNSRASPPRLEAAIGLALAHGAHLTGLYIPPRLEIPTYIGADVGVELLDVQREVVRNRTAEAQAAFSGAVARPDLAAEWRSSEGALAHTISLHGRYADLIVLGQADEEDPMSVSMGLADRVVLESGRPVLVIPYIGSPDSIGTRVIVAWNASREAVRAVNDALPILAGAQSVDVVAVNPVTGGDAHGEIPSADICLHLVRHGVKAAGRQVQAADIDVGDLLLSRAAEENVDLIVMGAYGHSRFREIVLGGATRQLLEHMTVPVLMSH